MSQIQESSTRGYIIHNIYIIESGAKVIGALAHVRPAPSAGRCLATGHLKIREKERKTGNKTI